MQGGLQFENNNDNDNDNENDNENMFITTDIYSISEQMQDINTSEKASNSNLPLIISMVKGAWSRSLWVPISVIRKEIFHFEGAENRKKVHGEGRMTSFYLH